MNKNHLVSESSTRTIERQFLSLRRKGRKSGRSGAFLVNLSRLLIPFFVLVSTTYCTTTTSLSPLGLYKVGIGASNLVDNILGTRNNNEIGDSASKTSPSLVHETKTSATTLDLPTKHKTKRKNNNTIVTNKKKRQDKNKDSLKRTNSETKKKTLATEKQPGKQADEDDENMFRIPGISEEDQKFLDRIQASARTVNNWDADEELLQKCRDQIPWSKLLDWEGDNPNDENPYARADVDRCLRASTGVGGADSSALVLQRLCRWFQSSMTWVNAPACKVCGCTDCEMKTVRGPETDEEIEGQARRVEVYYCPQCDANTTTFPRYNKAAKLFETRKGRCGEYANLFGLFCRSVGFETRLVLDWSDHLWTEVRLGDSWVMADGCEGVIDKPSMYEHGWGKDSLSYMMSIGRDHVVDVTPRYTRKFMTDDLQTRRREHTSSEEASAAMLLKLNEYMKSYPNVSSKSRLEELERRKKIEDADLQQCKQATEWTEQEKYGTGRISGSLAWKRSRQEAGSLQNGNSVGQSTEDLDSKTFGFPVESFMPPASEKGKVSFQLHACPRSRHDGIVVSQTPCAVGKSNSISVVIVDDNPKSFGCILQSKSFGDWSSIADFVSTVPSGRIVLMNGRIQIGNETKEEDSTDEKVKIARLGGWNGDEVAKKGVLFVGQVDAHPDWTFCHPLIDEKGDEISDGYEVEIDLKDNQKDMKSAADFRLRTERSAFPQRIAGRLPEAFMPVLRQKNEASEKEKREAYLQFAKRHSGQYCGYTTKKNSPVYLLDSTAYPLQQLESATISVLEKEQLWNTFLELPEPLVPSSDHGIEDPTIKIAGPKYDVPLDSGFFNSSLGPNIHTNVNTTTTTLEGLSNARLIGLYFSAHWCGPCRSFTPMLAEMYDHLLETNPTHGLEIVFVSGDRDEHSFHEYFQTMPWKAIPFNELQYVKQALNFTYGVRGIPSFVVLDAVSGEVVVSANESRQEVVTACRGGELRIEALLQSWLSRVPSSTKELITMLELSTLELENEPNETKEDDPAYLRRIVDNHSDPDDRQEISIRFKSEFEKLVNAGSDPNTAAAEALTRVSKIPVEDLLPTLTPGTLDGRASYAGACRSITEDPVDSALTFALENNSVSTVSEVLTTGLKYLQNAKKTPWEPKFRRFKLSNKIADKVTRVEGGLRLLQSLGFEVIATHYDFEASIPVGTDLVAMDTKMTNLVEQLKDR